MTLQFALLFCCLYAGAMTFLVVINELEGKPLWLLALISILWPLSLAVVVIGFIFLLLKAIPTGIQRRQRRKADRKQREKEIDDLINQNRRYA